MVYFRQHSENWPEILVLMSDFVSSVAQMRIVLANPFRAGQPVCAKSTIHLSSMCWLLLVCTKTIFSVEGALWLATQIPKIVCYLPPGNLRRICARRDFHRCRNERVKIIFLCYIIALFWFILKHLNISVCILILRITKMNNNTLITKICVWNGKKLIPCLHRHVNVGLT